MNDAENHKEKMRELQKAQREKTARNVKPERGQVHWVGVIRRALCNLLKANG